MPGNALQNAGFLDGTAGYYPYGGAALSVDDSAVGGPGRAALIATKTVTVGASFGISDGTTPAAAQGQVWEVQAATAGADTVTLQWLNSGGGVVHSDYVSKVRVASGSGRRGLRRTFDAWYGRFTAPSGTVKANLAVGMTATTAGAAKVVLLQPYLAPATADTRPSRWDPGSHVNPDLQLSVWPPSLPPFLADGLSTPTPNAKAFVGDSGIPIREDLYSGLHQDFRGHMRLNDESFDLLSSFYDTEREEFFLVRPDTNQLCVAEWLAEGAPHVTEVRGPWLMTEVGLHLRVA